MTPTEGARATATAPSRTATPAPTSVVDVPLDMKVGQMIMAGVGGTTVSDDARHVVGDLHIGNVILMGGNAGTPEQVLALTQGLQALAQDAHGVPLLIGTDQEGGLVQRLKDGYTLLPDAVDVGDTDRPELTRTYGAMVGEELAASGVNLDFAPDLDVNDNPANPVIGPRAFGSTPDVVVRNGIAFAQGLHDAGVVSIGKHFPGHGDTATDSHQGLPVVNKAIAGLQAVELPPFKAAITQGIDGLMIAHVAYPALDGSGLPATVSQPIVGGLLRGQLGFTGVVFTDDMGMKGIADVMSLEDAAVKAVSSGADVLLCVRIVQEGSCGLDGAARLQAALIAAVHDGRLSEARIDESYNRVLALKAKYHAGPADGVGIDEVGSAAHRAVAGSVGG
jgi:beta-N-acetylhexosaminidase